MSSKPTLVVSDVHLGAVPDRTESAFRDFLVHAAERGGELVVNGDLFDFWFEYRTVVPSRHYRVLAGLADLVDAGVPVRFLGGNHDAWAGSFLRDQVGLDILSEPAELRLAGRAAMIVHGDGVGRGEPGYRLLRRVLRSGPAEAAFRFLHPDLGDRIARAASSTSRRAARGEDPARSRAAFIEDWAVETLARRPDLDLLIAGHAHQPRVRAVGEGRWYLNAGDWLASFSYLEIPSPPAAPRLLRWR